MKFRGHYLSSVAAVLVATLGAATPAIAQSTESAAPASPAAALPAGQPAAAPAHNDDGDIVVTARLREERPFSAPVVLTGVGAAEIERRQITTIDRLAQVVPQLFVADSAGGVQGGVISIRGVGTGESNPFADQSVSFNIDGILIARSSVRRLAQADISQIEVLRGPQTLYFGKNSPGGVVSIRSADPTDHFESRVSAGYEFVGREIRGDGYVSGPLTPTLGARLFVYGSQLNGWIHNVATPSTLLGPGNSRLPHDREYGGRFTLLFQPSDRFRARLKINYGRTTSGAFGASTQLVSCPLGVPQLGGPENCRADNQLVRADPGPNFGRVLSPIFGDGSSYLHQSQFLAGLEMNYRLTDTLRLVSSTGYYEASNGFLTNLNNADSTNAARMIVAQDDVRDKEFSQQLRLQSEFHGPFNFQIGGYYQHTNFGFEADVAFNALAPAYVFPPADSKQRGDAYSGFVQAQYEITPQLELSLGGRYSYERKFFYPFNRNGTPIITVNPDDSWHDFSPEATIRWRPSEDVTLFASYKRGFLSGGFNGSSAPPAALAQDRAYGQQKNRGFEGGARVQLLDRRLRLSLSAYDYDILGLQVSAVTGLSTAPVLVVVNAGRANTRGVEFEANLRVSDSFSLRGAAAYNRARYNVFLGPCYAGQTVALGCNRLPNAAGVFQAQDQAGQQIPRAPAWSLLAGLNYSTPVAEGRRIAFSVDTSYTSSYFAQAQNNPASRQHGYALVDSTIAYRDDHSGYEIALIGRNLTNKYYFSRANDASFTGSGVGTSSPTARVADTLASVSRGREIMVRLTVQLDRLLN